MRGVKAGVVLLSALVVQAALIGQLDIFGARGDLLILVPITAALTVGPERGAIAGFVAGLAVDLLVTTPFGLTALTYSLVGYGVGAFQAGVLRATSWLPLVSAAVGAAVGTAFYALAATVVGEEGLLTADLGRVVAAVSLVALVLVLPALRLARWVEREVAGVGRLGRPRRFAGLRR
jgi:rod shape-determining protein MreD